MAEVFFLISAVSFLIMAGILFAWGCALLYDDDDEQEDR